jgi:hypothetical protein
MHLFENLMDKRIVRNVARRFYNTCKINEKNYPALLSSDNDEATNVFVLMNFKNVTPQ